MKHWKNCPTVIKKKHFRRVTVKQLELERALDLIHPIPLPLIIVKCTYKGWSPNLIRSKNLQGIKTVTFQLHVFKLLTQPHGVQFTLNLNKASTKKVQTDHINNHTLHHLHHLKNKENNRLFKNKVKV